MTEAATTKKPGRKAAPKAASTATPKADKGLYAVFATGGKQYRVRAGDTLKIEKLPGNHTEGSTLTFDSVLMTDNGGSEVTLGNPFIKDASVSATLVKMARNKTVDVIKYKQKSRYYKRYGHRQPHFEIRIDSIQ